MTGRRESFVREDGQRAPSEAARSEESAPGAAGQRWTKEMSSRYGSTERRDSVANSSSRDGSGGLATQQLAIESNSARWRIGAKEGLE